MLERQLATAEHLRHFRSMGFDFDELVGIFVELVESVGAKRVKWLSSARLWRLILLQARDARFAGDSLLGACAHCCGETGRQNLGATCERAS